MRLPWRRKLDERHESEIDARLGRIEHDVEKILHLLKPRQHFTSSVTLEGFEMSTTPTIPVPGNGVVNVNLFNADGSPFVPANFPSYVQNWAWSLAPGTDPGVSIAPSADTTSAAVTVAASDVATTF